MARGTNAGKERPVWWIATAITAALVIAAAVVLLTVNPVAEWVRLASNALKTGEVESVRMFITTHGGRSPLAALGLVVWQAVAFTLPFETGVRGSAALFGHVAGFLIGWAGLVAGACLLFGVARGLLGIPLSRARKSPAQERGVGVWLVLGLRLVPFVPQDLISLVCGATRLSFRKYLLSTTIGSLPAAAFFAIFANNLPHNALALYTWLSAGAGIVILGALAWLHRKELPFGQLSPQRKRQLLIGGAIVAVCVVVYAAVPAVRSWVGAASARIAAGDVGALRDYLRGFGMWAPLVSAVLMILQSLIAPLPAFVITFANGLLFGAWWGALLSWSSAMVGAALCFFIARSLGRPAVEKLVGGSTALAGADKFFDRFGRRAILIARLLPFVSFDVISYAAGLTSMGFWPFFLATGIGQIPATIVYSYLGQNMTSSVRVVFFSFVVFLAILILVATARPAFKRWLARDSHETP